MLMKGINEIYDLAMAAHRILVNLDLNLLVTLDVLLRERNVTRAAEQLGLSQPAVSAALARLRRHFGDELLVRRGNRYEVTPLALRLAERTPSALAGVSKVFDAAPDFDAATMEREFTIIVSDYAAAVLGPVLMQVVAEQAPGVRIRLQQTTPYAVDHAGDTLRAVDGIVLPHGFLRDIPVLDLYQDTWVCIVDRENPLVGEELTLDHLRTLRWVVLFNLPTAFAPSEQQLRISGIEPIVDVVVDSFLSMPYLVSGSSRIALVQARLAAQISGQLGVRVMASPVAPIPLEEAFWWHPMYRDDPAHLWLRGALRIASDRLTDSAQV